jgi:hypothetical protein
MPALAPVDNLESGELIGSEEAVGEAALFEAVVIGAVENDILIVSSSLFVVVVIEVVEAAEIGVTLAV